MCSFSFIVLRRNRRKITGESLQELYTPASWRVNEMSSLRDARSFRSWPAVLLMMLSCCRAAPWPHNGGTTGDHRLPSDTRPLSYELTLRPNYDRVTERVEFIGEVMISISVSSATNKVTLNCRDLKIYVVYVYEKCSNRSLWATEYSHDEANERLTISLEQELNIGVEYVLDIEFYGRVDNGSDGFYKSSYGSKE